MLKRFPSRNPRSKGVKVKHVLQILLLLGICFWLVYQVKHSHDKKKEFDGNGVKTSLRRESENDVEILRLGRKDLPREDVAQGEKPEEEEEEVAVTEEEEKREEEREEMERKREEERGEEEEENKNEEVEAEDGGGGDEEIDENDQERKDEDFVDEEKEQDEEGDEENRTENNEEVGDQTENENSSEDQDGDGGDQTYHEAREENYRADDASSEVTHEAHDALNKENKLTTGSASENLVISNHTENVNENESVTESVVGEGGAAGNSILTSGSLVQKVRNSSSNSVDKQLLETTQSNDQPEAGNNSVPVSTDSTNGSATKRDNSTVEVSTETINSSMGMRKETMDLSLQNSNKETVSGLGHKARNATNGDNKGEQAALREQTNNSTFNSENDKVDPNSAILAETENRDLPSKESSASSNNTETEALRPDKTAQVEDGAGSSGSKVNSDGARDEKSEDNEERIEEGSNSTAETDLTIQDDPIDSSDFQISQEANIARTDLDTLPELRSQGDGNEEEIAAE